MPEETVVLRALKQMGFRLVSQVSDDLCLVDHLYPKLLCYAGQRRAAVGVATMIRYAVLGVAGKCIHGAAPAHDPRFLLAIAAAMVEDPSALEEVKSYLLETPREAVG